MRYLADATWAIDFLANQPAAVALHPTLVRDGLALSVITYTEIWEGVLYTRRDPKAAERGLREFLRAVTILPYSRRVARRVALLRGVMRQRGQRIEHRALDILIAGTALSYDLTVVTSDTDFDDIPGLTRMNPRTSHTQQNPA
ncbi:MAG: type II toxin-antitoxin system VapC family toxin [Dehalococcoidia bacterium]